MKNKTTGKIERLNLKKKELEIKELELRIDKLLLETSPRLFVPNIQDQSQKQPKGETIRNYNPEKRWDKYKKSKIEVRQFDLVPKVQPEEKEEWEKRFIRTFGYWGEEIKFIKQLLKEREREVLEDIKGVNNEIYEGRTEILEVEIDNRLDKLNKEEK